MCNVLIFVKPDNNHLNAEEDWKKFKAGDVIDVNENDNFHWGADIDGPNALGWWRAVVVPDAPAVKLASLKASDVLPLVGLLPADPTTYPHRIRIFSVDVEKLQDKMSFEELMAIVATKPEITDSSAFGVVNVIG